MVVGEPIFGESHIGIKAVIGILGIGLIATFTVAPTQEIQETV